MKHETFRTIKLHSKYETRCEDYIYTVFFFRIFRTILLAKYRISAALMMENPVSSPMVPPIADIMSTNFAALSFLITSNVGVSK